MCVFFRIRETGTGNAGACMKSFVLNSLAPPVSIQISLSIAMVSTFNICSSSDNSHCQGCQPSLSTPPVITLTLNPQGYRPSLSTPPVITLTLHPQGYRPLPSTPPVTTFTLHPYSINLKYLLSLNISSPSDDFHSPPHSISLKYLLH